jgi:hypothetical protein
VGRIIPTSFPEPSPAGSSTSTATAPDQEHPFREIAEMVIDTSGTEGEIVHEPPAARSDSF